MNFEQQGCSETYLDCQMVSQCLVSTQHISLGVESAKVTPGSKFCLLRILVRSAQRLADKTSSNE